MNGIELTRTAALSTQIYRSFAFKVIFSLYILFLFFVIFNTFTFAKLCFLQQIKTKKIFIYLLSFAKCIIVLNI